MVASKYRKYFALDCFTCFVLSPIAVLLQEQLKQVRQLTASHRAFAAVLADGSVVGASRKRGIPL